MGSLTSFLLVGGELIKTTTTTTTTTTTAAAATTTTTTILLLLIDSRSTHVPVLLYCVLFYLYLLCRRKANIYVIHRQ